MLPNIKQWTTILNINTINIYQHHVALPQPNMELTKTTTNQKSHAKKKHLLSIIYTGY